MSPPLRLTEWHEYFLRHGAIRTAEIWLQRLAEIPEATQRAALTALPPIPALQQRFLDAWDQRDQPLGGVPFLAKDLFATAGDRTGAGSVFLRRQLGPANRDASLVSHLREQGTVLCGKTQLNEFAFGMSGENPHFGDCPHPRRADLLSGGSSSGSAWAVGSGLVPFALGTDTSGSIRVPAAFCGLHGVRLQPGLLEPEELFPLAPTFDTPGWLAHSWEDLCAVGAAVLGAVENSSSHDFPRRLWLAEPEWLTPEVSSATSRFATDCGFATDPVAAKEFFAAIQGIENSYAVLSASEAAQIHGLWLSRYQEEYDPVVWQRLEKGRLRTAEEISSARQHRERIALCFENLFNRFDVIALPVTPCPAQPKGGHNESLRRALLHLNTPASMASLPAITLPVPLPSGLTTGIQLVFPTLESLRAALSHLDFSPKSEI